MDFKKNNLDRSVSPYLRQHSKNPVWWQEWSKETVNHAKEKNMPIFVSVGYSTCHWCHVMAREAFSDKKIADYLNENFISIKVDREQRADIDQFLMGFITETTGHGGWPLNAFLTPDIRPFFALTYSPVESKFGLPGFIDVLKGISNFYKINQNKIKQFNLRKNEATSVKEDSIIQSLQGSYDPANGGFGFNMKFPPHCTLLFMLYYFEYSKDEKLRDMIISTLDNISLIGLHDHLQGGFFRYCVDREWEIPHFEKMLYDQAMLLLAYSLAYKVLGKKEYNDVAKKILKCLEETYENKGLYFSAHNADTLGEEGKTYLWSEEELKKHLTKEELRQFTDVYTISKNGNFEGLNHLIKKKNLHLDKIESKLLKIRNKREQPFTDKKIITSWNCLLGIAFVHSYRYLENQEASLKKAELLFESLIKTHYKNGKLSHSSFLEKLQDEEFLQDYACMLLFITYLHEETGIYEKELKEFYKKTLDFKKNDKWIESSNKDFITLAAERFDHPIPSSVSLAELAVLRADILMKKDYEAKSFSEPMNHDFFNIVSLLSDGYFNILESQTKLDWNHLPINSIQVRSDNIQNCFKGKCQRFKSKDELMKHLNSEKNYFLA